MTHVVDVGVPEPSDVGRGFLVFDLVAALDELLDELLRLPLLSPRERLF